MSFKFSVPATAAEDVASAETRPKQAREWAEGLSLARAPESARALCAALYGQNRIVLGDDDRLRLLEIYRPVLQALVGALAADYEQTPLPLTDRARESVNLTRDLLIEYAYGYKLILLEKAGKLIFSSKRQMPMLLHRAISALADTLSLCYKTYSPTPAGVWHEIHQIYHYAAYFSLETAEVDTGDQGGVSTIALVYKQALLLALADPYHLMPGDVQKVLAVIAHYHGTALVTPYSADLNGAGMFLVQSDSDRPPKALGHSANARITPVDKILCAATMVEAMAGQRARIEQQQGQIADVPAALAHAGADLLRRLEKSWSSPQKRVFHRFAANTSVEICAGLRATAHYLRRGQARAEAEALQRRAAIPLDLARPNPSRKTYEITSWELVNQSAGGLALKRIDGSTPSVAVGDAVGVRFPGQEAWAIGVARWLQGGEAGSIEFGVQMLAPTARAITLEPFNETGRRPAALLLPELPALKQAAALLTPIGVHGEGRNFHFTDRNGARTHVRARRLVEQTAAFELFEFDELPD